MATLASKLTVILPVYNEEHRIEAALRNFHGKAPIVVIDNFSTDSTLAVAKKYTDRLVQRKNSGFATREDYEFMFAQAKTEWVLIIYAGHHFPQSLVAAIEQAVLSEKYDAVNLTGYAVQYGKKTNVYGWDFRQKFTTTRCFKKSVIDLSQSRIHHELPYVGDLGRVYFPPLNNDHRIANYRDDDLAMMNRKTITYSEEEARQLHAAGRSIKSSKVYFSFFWHVCKRLFWRLAIFEGPSGMIIAISESYRYFCVDARLWELTQGKDQAAMRRENIKARDRILRADGR